MFKSDEIPASDISKELKDLKKRKFIISVIFIAIGVLMLIWPAEVLDVLARSAGAFMGICGIAGVVMYFLKKEKGISEIGILVASVIIGVLGVELLYNPELLVKGLPTIMGLLVIMSGISDVEKALRIRKEHGSFGIALLLSIITIVLGVLIVMNPESVSGFIMRLIGVVAVFDGVSDIWIMSQITGVVKEIREVIEGTAEAGEEAPKEKKNPFGFLKKKAKDETAASSETEAASVPSAEEILDGDFAPVEEPDFFPEEPEVKKEEVSEEPEAEKEDDFSAAPEKAAEEYEEPAAAAEGEDFFAEEACAAAEDAGVQEAPAPSLVFGEQEDEPAEETEDDAPLFFGSEFTPEDSDMPETEANQDSTPEVPAEDPDAVISEAEEAVQTAFTFTEQSYDAADDNVE